MTAKMIVIFTNIACFDVLEFVEFVAFFTKSQFLCRFLLNDTEIDDFILFNEFMELLNRN